MKLFLLVLCMGTAAAQAQVTVRKDVSYLGAERAEKMDIYTPAKHSGLVPAVLLIHGGGWTVGDKADARGISISTEVAGQGYAVFAINYQLATAGGPPALKKGAFPQNIFDCKSALRFIRESAAQLGVDPKRIAVMGESAGGHLALLVGSTQHADALNRGGVYLGQSVDVRCVIDMYGVYDLADPTRKGDWTAFKGADEAGTEENLWLANPVNHVDGSMPPTLILHGTADQMVDIAQSERLEARLKELAVPSQFVTVPGGKHSFDLHPKEMDLRPVVFAFLKKYLAGS